MDGHSQPDYHTLQDNNSLSNIHNVPDGNKDAYTNDYASHTVANFECHAQPRDAISQQHLITHRVVWLLTGQR